MSVGVIDYGMGNLASVSRALAEAGVQSRILTAPSEIKLVDSIILPGVGSFAKAMENLTVAGWREEILGAVNGRSKPLLGICLGMQLLADSGEEHGETPGLGLVSGRVRKFSLPAGSSLRIPHVGWNEIDIRRDDRIFDGIEDKTDCYFVHSYYFSGAKPEDILATTPYGIDFPAIIRRENVCGMQFHPEKSGAAGLKLLHNALKL